MKHSEALKVRLGDLLALNRNKDEVLWEVVDILFPGFMIREMGTDYRKITVDYCYFSKPTKAQLNAYNKRKEKYYAEIKSNTSTNTTSSRTDNHHR